MEILIRQLSWGE